MAKLSKALQAASVSGAAGLNVEEVFSTYVYEGNNSSQTITNGIDLAGEGGMVWVKNRSVTADHQVADTERGSANFGTVIHTNNTDSEVFVGSINSTNSDGFDIVSAGLTNYNVNILGNNFASWTWRKAPKFFDIQTWTGNLTAGRVIPHNLGSLPGMIITKCYSDSAPDWTVWHRNRNGTNTHLRLNEINLPYPGEDISAVTDTTFTVGNDNRINGASPRQYVAYIFANNNNDGDFGPNADQDIIKCGSDGGTGVDGNFVNLGFEPQWILIKNVTSNANWMIYDNIRGISDENTDYYLRPAQAFNEGGHEALRLRPNGFELVGSHIESNTLNNTYIYMAIRRPMGAFGNVNDLFGMVNAVGGVADPVYLSNFPVDFAFRKDPALTENWYVGTRISQLNTLFFNTTNGYNADPSNRFDHMDGWRDDNDNAPYQSWMWRRARGFFDVISYEGDGQQQHDVTHNLGVVPEMMWIKLVTGTNNNWAVYHKDLDPTAPEDYYVPINGTNTVLGPNNSFWNSVKPTSTQITLGPGGVQNANGSTYVGYLFASIAGISKVGSYVGNGTSQNIDCGFSNGASFVLIRSASTTVNSNWVLVDTRRGLNNEISLSGNTPQVNNGEIASFAGGFALNNTNSSDKNANGTTYIFYAIAAP